jgi:hypothetical protein
MKYVHCCVLFVMVSCGCGAIRKDGAANQGAANQGAASSTEALDSRTPVPLLPMMAEHQKENMRDHLIAVQEIVGALAAEDFVGVERSARRMGFSEQMGKMCSHMGRGAAGFTEQALGFHHAADRIGAAALQGDRVGVLRELGTTLQACTGCHARFKQQVVDEASWQRLTANSN